MSFLRGSAAHAVGASTLALAFLMVPGTPAFARHGHGGGHYGGHYRGSYHGGYSRGGYGNFGLFPGFSSGYGYGSPYSYNSGYSYPYYGSSGYSYPYSYGGSQPWGSSGGFCR